MMDEEQVKEELMLHMAKMILENSLASRDNVFRTVSTVSIVAVPAYLTVLTKSASSTASVSLWVQLLPVLLWIMNLFVCVMLLFPRYKFFDLKNVADIVAVHSESTRRLRRWVLWSYGLLIAGIGVAAYVIVIIHSNISHTLPL